jgi:hypothetical protein
MRAAVLALTILAWMGLCSGQTTYDDSDWWSLIRQDKPDACSKAPSKEKPDGANFVVAGVDLRQGQPLRDAEKRVAKVPTVNQRGDSGSSRRQMCFQSESDDGRFKLIFEEGEVASAAYLIDGGPDWIGSDRCVTSPKISGNLATESGLHLGMTVAQAERILGKPCIESNDNIEYSFVQQHGNDKDPNEYWDWGTIQIRFRGANAYYIATLTGETN